MSEPEKRRKKTRKADKAAPASTRPSVSESTEVAANSDGLPSESESRAASAPALGRPGWNVPKPEHIPSPSYYPAGVALGVTFLLWGIVTSLVVVAIGATVLVVSLTGWIGEMRHEAKHA